MKTKITIKTMKLFRVIVFMGLLFGQSVHADDCGGGGDIMTFLTCPQQSLNNMGTGFGDFWNNTVKNYSDILTLGDAGRRRDQERAEQQAKYYAAQAQKGQQQLQLQTQFVKSQVSLVFDYYCGDLKTLSRIHELKLNTARTLLLMKGALLQTISAANNIEVYRAINDSLKNQLVSIETEIRELTSDRSDKSVLDFNKILVRLSNLAKSSNQSTELLLSYVMSKLYQSADSAATSLKMMAMLQANTLVLLNDFESQIEGNIQKTLNINASNLAQLMILSPQETPTLLDGTDSFARSENEIQCAFRYNRDRYPHLNEKNTDCKDCTSAIDRGHYVDFPSMNELVWEGKNEKVESGEGESKRSYSGVELILYRAEKSNPEMIKTRFKEFETYIKAIESIMFSATKLNNSDFDKINVSQYLDFKAHYVKPTNQNAWRKRQLGRNLNEQDPFYKYFSRRQINSEILSELTLFAKSEKIAAASLVYYVLNKATPNANEALLALYKAALNDRTRFALEEMLHNMNHNYIISIEPEIRKQLTN